VQEFTQQVLSGIASGSVFAMLALSLVMVYRSTSVLNFGQGEMALFSTFVAWSFLSWLDSFWLAFVFSIVVAAMMGAALERFVLRPVEEAAVLNAVIVTLGLFTIFSSLSLAVWGPLGKSFGPFSVFKGPAIDLGPASIGRAYVGILVAAVIVMVLLFLLFRQTKLGLAMRAVAQNRLASRLVGIKVGQILSIGWGLSAALGAAAGALVAQTSALQLDLMFNVLLYAMAAAVLGGLDSPVGAVVGGLAIGITKNMAGTYIDPSVDVTVAFLIIVIVLMIRPTGIFGRHVLKRV
jgi:branched-chain amino acid transport system permease protein